MTSKTTIDQFLIGGFKNFVYLLCHNGRALVVDPQADLKPWEIQMRQREATLQGVLLTHTHWDHVAGLPAVLEKYPDVKIYVHKADAGRLKKECEARLEFVTENDDIELAGAKVKVLHTPGHSAGECCYLIEGTPPSLLTGDTVFVGEVGRTDLETGSTAELFTTLQRLKTLPQHTVIYPGHDYGVTPTSTIERECRESAAFKCTSIEELDALP